MKSHRITKTLALTVAGSLALLACKASAQDGASAPQMPGAVTEVLKLEQAKVGDSVIIAYIRKPGNSYSLDADQIVYLRQQGVSDAVLAAMLSQPKQSYAASEPAAAAPAPQPVASAPAPSPAPAPTVVAQPVYVQPAPTYYYPAYSYYPYYYPSYGYWGPRVGVGLGFGGHGWRLGVRF